MLPNRTDRALAAALFFTVVLVAWATMALNATVSQAYVLGAADGTAEAAPLAAQLHARTYRLVMDSSRPLESYEPIVEAYRAQGMRPQIVVDGTGTGVRGRTGKNWQTINYAVRAFRRWPDAYAVSVMNEPNESGISACQYARTYRRAYKMLKAAGVPRVLFGEWSPNAPVEWTTAVLSRCHIGSLTSDGFAWHCYDAHPSWFGIGHAAELRRYLRSMRRFLRTPHGNALPMYCTEYGVITRGMYASGWTETQGAQRWGHAFAVVRKYQIAEIVAWGIAEVPPGSAWDSSVVRADGTPRPAFATIASAR